MQQKVITKIFLAIVLWAICLSSVIGQSTTGLLFPDSLKQSKLYFSPYNIYTTMPAVSSIIKVGDPFDSTLTFQYSYDDNMAESDKFGTIEEKQKGITFLIDTTQEIDESEYFVKTYKHGSLYASPKKITYFDSKNRLISVPCNKDTSFMFKTLPVYILNNTGKIKAVYLRGIFIEIIQEALDKKGNWRPIESSSGFKCGMGFGWRALNPNELIVTNIFRYKGNYKTLLRLKFTNGKTIYYSKPFTGSINYSQLNSGSIRYIDGLPYER